jgi:hypothetical protein
MTTRRAIAVVLSWASLVAWTCIYAPLVVRSVLREGAGGVAALALVIALLGGIAAVMTAFSLRVQDGGGSRKWRVVGLGFLVMVLAAYAVSLGRSLPSNLDLLLPASCLAVCVAGQLITATAKSPAYRRVA